MLITHLLPPLIIILLFLLSIPNIRLVYQVQVQVSSVHIDFEMENLQISKQHSDGILQISWKKPRVGLIDSSLALCLVASGGEGQII